LKRHNLITSKLSKLLEKSNEILKTLKEITSEICPKIDELISEKKSTDIYEGLESPQGKINVHAWSKDNSVGIEKCH
jgi:hypothetical protein